VPGGPPRSAYHFMNAYTDGPRVHLDFGLRPGECLPFIREASGIQVQPHDLGGGFVRWTFDLSKPGEGFEETVLGPGGDMPRAAEKDAMRDYEIGLLPDVRSNCRAAIDRWPGRSGIQHNHAAPGADRQTEEFRARPAINRAGALPSQFPRVRRSTRGIWASSLTTHAENQSEVYILEAEHIEKGPLARIKVPFRLRVGVHGNWVPAQSL